MGILEIKKSKVGALLSRLTVRQREAFYDKFKSVSGLSLENVLQATEWCEKREGYNALSLKPDGDNDANT